MVESAGGRDRREETALSLEMRASYAAHTRARALSGHRRTVPFIMSRHSHGMTSDVRATGFP